MNNENISFTYSGNSYGCNNTATATAMTFSAMKEYHMQRRPESLAEMTPKELYDSGRSITEDYRQKVPEFEKFCEDVLDKELNRRKDFTSLCKNYYRIETTHMTYIFHVRDLYKIE